MSMSEVTTKRRVATPLLRLPVRQKASELSAHDQMVHDYLAQLGTSRALAVWLIYSSGDHADLLQLSVDFQGIEYGRGIDHARRDYAATKLLSCADYLNLDIDREAVALKSGALAESLNAKTNQFLRDLRAGRIIDHGFNTVLHRAAQKIAKVLGPLSTALHSMVDGGWTTGRSTAVTSKCRSSPEKYEARLDVTGAALRYGVPLVGSSAVWSQSALRADAPCCVLPRAFTIVDHNVAMTVPKNAKTDRLICYEPHVNIRLQRSVGTFIRTMLLRRANIDLSNQQVNQHHAWWGSKFGWFATLDLSMASDTLCFELVRDLLPSDWFEFLNDLRARRTLWPDGHISLNEKFSSMGNGFTFELETLVFWAIASTVSSTGWATAYGDDIVVFQDDFHPVVAALSKAGFKINEEKSFSTGSFRESCGGDYYRGVDVTPVYLDHAVDTVEPWILFHNKVRAYARRDTQPHVSWSRLMRRWRKTIEPFDPKSQRARRDLIVPLGPHDHGDGHFHVNFEEALPPRHPHGWQGWEFDSIVKIFTDRLTSDRLDDGSVFYTRLSSKVARENPSSLLAAALGPKRPFSVYTLLKEQNEYLHVKRSRQFCFAEWPDVTYW